MKKLVVFDLDGTLVDSLADIANACNYTLRTLGYPEHSYDKIRELVGRGAKNLVYNMLPNHVRDNDETFQKAYLTYREYYADNMQNETAPYPDIMPLLRELKENKVQMAVLSNKPHEDTKKIVHTTFGHLMDLVIGQRENVPRKPDPTSLIELMKTLNVRPEDTVYVGDTGVDMKTGRNAQVFTVGVSWGFRSRNVLKDAGANEIIDTAAELNKIVL